MQLQRDMHIANASGTQTRLPALDSGQTRLRLQAPALIAAPEINTEDADGSNTGERNTRGDA